MSRSSQPSISRFFKSSSSPAKPPAPPVPKKQPVEVIDLGDDSDSEVSYTISSPQPTPDPVPEPVKEEQVASKSPSDSVEPTESRPHQEKAQRFAFDKNAPPGQITQEQQQLRAQYKRKLTLTTFSNRDSPTEDAVSDAEEDNEESVLPATKKAKKAPAKSKSKLTPLDEQVVQLKLLHLDKILAIQVGYKYKFYCEDAVKVHKILNIALVPGKLNIINETPADKMYNKLAYCSIPEPRLHIHLQRLLDKGMKVGVVGQVEQSAIKSMEAGNKSALFKRQITDVFTKATYIEYDDKGHGVKDDRSLDSLVAIIETPNKDSTVTISLVSIQPLTGEIVYDEFKDDHLRIELETRLLHLEPIEILHFDKNLSQLTNKIIDNFIRLHTTEIRILPYPSIKRTYYETFMNDFVSANDSLFDFISSKSLEFQACCSLLIEYLTEFQLESAFKVVTNYVNFSNIHHMILNANTLQNLDVFQNSTTFEEYGSLLWLLNHTRTKFGFRLLRKWISRPLVHRESIEKRLDAVENIQNEFHHFLEALADLLKSCPDLEKMLSRIHYGKVKRKELYLFLSKLDDISRLVVKFGKFDIVTHVRSPLLKELLERLVHIVLDTNVSQYVEMINSQYAMDDRTDDYVLKYFNLNKLTVNQDEIITEDEAIAEIKSQLDEELSRIRNIFKRPSMEYVEKNREPYLIEVRNQVLKLVPKDWVKISSTKLVSRFRSPQIIALYTQLKYHNELYLNACQTIFTKFIKHIDEHYTSFADLIKCLSQYDCLLSLSAASAAANMTRPKFVDSKIIRVHNGRNPTIEQLRNYVPNDINMDERCKCMVITGPNMGGKSSYVKQVALIVIMAQVGCFVPAESATLGIFNQLLTRMGAQDDLIKGESTFYTEMTQMLNVLQSIKAQRGNSLVILDEIGRGTGTVDGISIAGSILEHLASEVEGCLTLFITHFPSVCKLEKRYPEAIQNYHMGYIEEKSHEGDWPKVTFLYNLVKGIASNSYGLNVAKLAFIDEKIIQKAFEVSKERQRYVDKSHKVAYAMDVAKVMNKVIKQGDDNSKNVQKLIELYDELDT